MFIYNIKYVILELVALALLPLAATWLWDNWGALSHAFFAAFGVIAYGLLVYDRKSFLDVDPWMRAIGFALGLGGSVLFLTIGLTDPIMFLRLATLGIALYYFELAGEYETTQLQKFFMAVVVGGSMLAETTVALIAALIACFGVFISFLFCGSPFKAYRWRIGRV
ncbi:MAG: hypothetical protein A3C84_03065 [Candidatus Ryanbacteria bacterium RIFCSPHIGHO2_02_FULL_48_12]|uniref:Uncharacterized protein n=1 Tax=Candidatus Ryanbacteria bacterium RIFCSPHIGHO2_01_FULL_48_27 TaxID=1802115 RepID=A0A1G2G4Y4_9BACT|nr:MAG: hypothetical protein A2756_01535 [Candidatus Ryanbacteria bacterium RIFCSPHIGHO2_01_FULL_48_27]OGZ49081.1 MAG: hypothetical protein A3C84_03065 [Candidatus Ryanbacteria bacterium RIFCSPHIGHO2_02_FULL_48_12]